MKRFVTILFASLLLTAALCVNAAASDYDSAAKELSAIGMFRGTDRGFELDRAPTRSEAAIMLVRLYGAEEEARSGYAAGTLRHPFTDVGETASPAVAWLYTKGIVNGTSDSTFGTGACSARNYAVFLLRALGYRDGKDFQYEEAIPFAMSKGLFSGSFSGGTFLRDDLAAVTDQALACRLADGSTCLLDSLVRQGAVEQAAARPVQKKIELCQKLTAASAALQKGMDAELTVKMVMNTGMSGTAEGQPIGGTMRTSTSAAGRMQAVWDKTLQLGMELEQSAELRMTAPDGQEMVLSQPAVTTGTWIKDNWMYTRQDELRYKTPLNEDDAGLPALYKTLLPGGGTEGNAAMLMPYLETVRTAKNGGNTVYTLTIGKQAFQGLINDLLRAESGQGNTDLPMDAVLDRCVYTYTIDSSGRLKAMTAGFELSFNADMEDGAESVSMNMDMTAETELRVKTAGSSVRIAYPDLSAFPELKELPELPAGGGGLLEPTQFSAAG